MAPPTRENPKVLLVEDNEMNRDMLARRLRKIGYEVEIAVNGQEGVIKATQDRPDIVLMDMSLPVMDGWEATRNLKANPDTQQIPVIALTAHAMASDREKAMAAGCDEYDTKPIDWSRLMGKVDALINQPPQSLS
ncbi:MAG: response regulator [Cyanobacteria bacterium J06554_6]